MAQLEQLEKSRTKKQNPLKSLHDEGQAVWLDYLSRPFLAEGGLDRLIEQDGLSGVTSNPSIFEKAIAEGSDYDAQLKEALESDALDVMALYERLAIADIRHAADKLRPVYDVTRRADGYVSLEVSPYLAMDTEATVSEARRLAQAVERDNVMVKVPATKAGLPAIRRLIGEGVNVNITLLFSQKVYEEVVEAYLAGLEHFIAHGGDPAKVASVASFFVSRIDVAVDKLIETRAGQEKSAEKKELLSGLRGKVAVANAKLAYQHYARAFADGRWEKLKAHGARVQRLLWASTSVKNPDYRDVLYVEELIGRDTVNTMPPKTMDAFRDHGRVRPSLEADIGDAEQVMSALARAGIAIDEVTDRLTDEGVRLFADSFDQLLGALARKRAAFLGDQLDRQTVKLPGPIENAVASSLEDWRKAGNVRRLWAGDASLWTGHDENRWLGWLDIIDTQRRRLTQLNDLAADIRGQNFSHAVLLGMGGSSLGAEVLATTFGSRPGHPALLVLDSTDPEQIAAVEKAIDVRRTLFIVSSKSGSTLEPNILKDYFYDKVKTARGVSEAGSHFIAVTDPGSALESMAKRDGFRHVAYGEPGIGGRYSVLSDFGMAPAAVIGLDMDKLLSAAQGMARACGSAVPPADNPGIVLGTVLAAAARAGRDKITIVASPAIADFGAWLEQLLAESTGKQGKGLIPVDAEPLGAPALYGEDRLFAYVRLADGADETQDRAIEQLERAGHPVVRIAVADRLRIGQEFFRWEIATAVVGAIIGIDPFDQPDVEASKVKARELTEAYEKSGKLPEETPLVEENGIKVFADAANAEALRRTGKGKTLAGLLQAHLARLGAGDYCALLAYMARDRAHWAALQELRRAIRDAKHVATCVGFGPRFLHSTGQAYKGGPNTGVFLELTGDARHDLPVPGHKLSFGAVIAAQSRGDFSVLNERKRRALRVHLGADIDAGLKAVQEALRQALR
jgi:transaldolase / glucose-6-phosphate isomerase